MSVVQQLFNYNDPIVTEFFYPTSIYSDGNNLWVLTSNNGYQTSGSDPNTASMTLLKIDIATFTQISITINIQNIIINGTTYSLNQSFVSDGNNLWIGLYNNTYGATNIGLTKINISSGIVENNYLGISENIVFVSTNNIYVWVLSYSGNLYKISCASPYEIITTIQLYTYSSYSMSCDETNLWIAAVSDGYQILQINCNDNSLYSINTPYYTEYVFSDGSNVWFNDNTTIYKMPCSNTSLITSVYTIESYPYPAIIVSMVSNGQNLWFSITGQINPGYPSQLVQLDCNTNQIIRKINWKKTSNAMILNTIIGSNLIYIISIFYVNVFKLIDRTYLNDSNGNDLSNIFETFSVDTYGDVIVPTIQNCGYRINIGNNKNPNYQDINTLFLPYDQTPPAEETNYKAILNNITYDLNEIFKSNTGT